PAVGGPEHGAVDREAHHRAGEQLPGEVTQVPLGDHLGPDAFPVVQDALDDEEVLTAATGHGRSFVVGRATVPGSRSQRGYAMLTPIVTPHGRPTTPPARPRPAVRGSLPSEGGRDEPRPAGLRRRSP